MLVFVKAMSVQGSSAFFWLIIACTCTIFVPKECLDGGRNLTTKWSKMVSMDNF